MAMPPRVTEKRLTGFVPQASVSASCSTCHGASGNAKTLEIEYRGRHIADVLKMTVQGAEERHAKYLARFLG